MTRAKAYTMGHSHGVCIASKQADEKTICFLDDDPHGSIKTSYAIPSGSSPDDFVFGVHIFAMPKALARSKLLDDYEKGLEDGIRLALANRGIAPEKDES